MTIRDEVTRTVVETSTEEEDRESLPQGLGRRLLSLVAGPFYFIFIGVCVVSFFYFWLIDVQRVRLGHSRPLAKMPRPRLRLSQKKKRISTHG